MGRWKNISITKKLYFVVGIMAVLIAGELVTLRFAMNTLSAVRAFVGGEGLWSKAQKNAAFSIQRYALTRNESDYEDFLNYLKVPDGDHRARLALLQAQPDHAAATQGLLDGEVHADDIPGVIQLLERFYWINYLERAIKVWTEGDRLLGEFKNAGIRYHGLATSPVRDELKLSQALTTIQELNEKLTPLESEFSRVLGEGSRWLERLVLTLLFLAVLTVESIGLTLAFRTARQLSRGLAALTTAASRIGQGDFKTRLAVESKDEIGVLSESVNTMGGLLEKSYTDLETRVAQRTVELKDLAATNAKLYEQAAAAIKVRDEFLSIASHELKTPLTALQMHVQLSLREKDPEKSRIILESAIKQTKRLNTLIDELLDLTRIRHGKLVLHREPCDLALIAKETVSQLSSEAARAGCALNINALAPVYGQFDSVRMAQVFVNLISNAIKYAPGRPIDVDVLLHGNQAIARVRDQGPGISPEVQPTIFERFERGEAGSDAPGLGLGLYIAKQIVEAHNGSLNVASQQGEGATFTVAFRASA